MFLLFELVLIGLFDRLRKAVNSNQKVLINFRWFLAFFVGCYSIEIVL